MLAGCKPARPLTPAWAGQLVAPRAGTKQGEMAFSHNAAQQCNQAPWEITGPTAASFKRLKSIRFLTILDYFRCASLCTIFTLKFVFFVSYIYIILNL